MDDEALRGDTALMLPAEVLVVAAAVAYDEYLRHGAYVCQPGRSFRGSSTHLAFYHQGAVQAEVPVIRWRRDGVIFSLDEVEHLRSTGRQEDDECADVIEAVLGSGARTTGDVQEVLALSSVSDSRTMQLRQPVPNASLGSSGQRVAFTQSHRYVHLDDLRRVAAAGGDTQGLVPSPLTATQPDTAQGDADRAPDAAAGAASGGRTARQRLDPPAAPDLDGFQELTLVVDALKRDVVFAASLGSKELFHSNLLGWYVEHDPKLGAALVEAWTGQSSVGPFTVRRELTNLDLVIYDPSGQACLVIENKTFSLPDDDQLARYGERLSNLGSPTAVLLSVTPPAWPTNSVELGGHLWRHRSYRELRTILDDAAPEGLGPTAEVMLRGWRELLGRLEDLISIVATPAPDEPWLLSDPAREQLLSVRLDGPVQRTRAQHLAARVAAVVGGEQGVKFGAGLTNGAGLVQGFREISGSRRIGWQLQHTTWRLAIIYDEDSGLHGKGRHEERAADAQILPWFDFDAYPLLCGRPSLPATGFNRYDPNFVYRYVDVQDLTVDQIVDLGIQCMQRAAEVPLQRG